jgi:hypothetical protein
MKKIDETGNKYGRLTVIESAGSNKKGNALWLCRCDCGKEITAIGISLRSQNTRSCGCFKIEKTVETGKKKVIDLAGRRFGRLVVISRKPAKRRRAYWNCLCDCGNTTVVLGSELLRKRTGRTGSCGCASLEKFKAMTSQQRGEKNPKWNGGKTIHDKGYVQILDKEHLRAHRGTGYVYEHILIMEKMLGRALKPGECVHHCNGDKADNRPYNLRLFKDNSEHMAYHFKAKREGEKRREHTDICD